jgi:hypothetical protein
MPSARNRTKSKIISREFHAPTDGISLGILSTFRWDWWKPIMLFSFAVSVCFFASGMLGQDVQMSAPDNASATKNNSTTQSETNHVVTPNGIIGAWNDSGQWATMGTMFTSFIGWRGSANGTAFSGGGFFTLPSNTQCIGDPAVVADASGFIYIAGLGSQGGAMSHVGVARSTGTLPPFSFGTATLIAAPSGGALDKELMSIDRTGGSNNNRIYMTATNLNTGRILEAHSTALNPPAFSVWHSISPNSGGATGSMSAVAPNGDVYVVWERNGNTYEVVKSSDGGSTFSNPDTSDPALAKVITTVANASPLLFASPPNPIKVVAFPQIAIDSTAVGSPTRGYIYVVFHADPDGAGPDQADIFFTRSTDAGVTWSVPRSITSGPAATIGQDTTTNDSWNPSITVSPVNGHIYITFYDRREDTTSGDGDPVNTKTRVYRALSTDAGQTFNVAPLGTSTFVPIGGFTVAGSSNNYWGEYNWSQANADGMQFTWGDSHNLCSPPGGASNPCSPSGRPDLDAYYHTVSNLSGPDLFIKPWGAVTGEGPTWQTPYIYVVDASDVQINASKGTINRLRARVRNLGSAAASGALVHFRYAPWFAGVNDSLFKDVGPAVSVNLSAAGGGTDDQVIPINWDLTDLTDTNGGLWPQPISAYQHFCLKVIVELASDINLSNNSAQNNFFDVGTSAPGGSSPLSFMIVGPDKRESERTSFARIDISKLPGEFRASVNVKGVEDASKGFRLRPNEVRNATVVFASPKNYKSRRDVVANITLLLDGKPNGGISARLYHSPVEQKAVDVIGATKAHYWEVRPEDKTEKIKCEEQRPPEPPPARTIPKPVKYRRTYQASYEKTYQAVLSVLRERKLGPELANFERGLINTRGVKASRAEIARLVVTADQKKVNADGYYVMSIWLEPHDGRTEVGVDALIATNDVEAPIGRRFPSNVILERSILTAIASALRQ